MSKVSSHSTSKRLRNRWARRWLCSASVTCLILTAMTELHAAPSNRPDPCSLVNSQDAEAALGLKVTGPERNSGFGQFEQCQYLASGERLLDIRSATVQVHATDLASLRKAYADHGEKLEPIAGVGEAAFWAPGQSFLFVQKGKVTVGFAVHRPNTDLLKASRELAATALARAR